MSSFMYMIFIDMISSRSIGEEGNRHRYREVISLLFIDDVVLYGAIVGGNPKLT